MLLAFDVGNSNIVFGVFKENHLVTNWRIETDQRKSADEYGMLVKQLFTHEGLKMEDVEDVIVSTVVPSVLFTIQHMTTKYFNKKPIVIEPGVKTGLIIKYDNPGQVGADRIVNAVAALNKYGGPLIVIDFGTATTFCAVTENGEYLGGSIAPGLKISSEALFEKTSKLPKVELEAPGKAICRNTITSMQAGLIYGHMGVVDYIVDKMKKELTEYQVEKIREKDENAVIDAKEIKEPLVVATGGLATMIEEGIECVDYIDKMLTLEGLQIIYKKNKKCIKKKLEK